MSDEPPTVEEAIRQDIYLQEILARDIQNRKAVARWLKKYRGIEEDVEAIVSTIRRMDTPEHPSLFEDAREALVDVKVGVRGGVSVLVVKRNAKARQRLDKILEVIDVSERRETFRFVPSPSSLTVVMDEEKTEAVTQALGDDLIKDQEDDLTELSFKLSRTDRGITGIMGLVLTFLAQRGVSVSHTMTAAEHQLLLVPQDQHQDAVDAINSLVIEPAEDED